MRKLKIVYEYDLAKCYSIPIIFSKLLEREEFIIFRVLIFICKQRFFLKIGTFLFSVYSGYNFTSTENIIPLCLD